MLIEVEGSAENTHKINIQINIKIKIKIKIENLVLRGVVLWRCLFFESESMKETRRGFSIPSN